MTLGAGVLGAGSGKRYGRNPERVGSDGQPGYAWFMAGGGGGRRMGDFPDEEELGEPAIRKGAALKGIPAATHLAHRSGANIFYAPGRMRKRTVTYSSPQPPQWWSSQPHSSPNAKKNEARP